MVTASKCGLSTSPCGRENILILYWDQPKCIYLTRHIMAGILLFGCYRWIPKVACVFKINTNIFNSVYGEPTFLNSKSLASEFMNEVFLQFLQSILNAI